MSKERQIKDENGRVISHHGRPIVNPYSDWYYIYNALANKKEIVHYTDRIYTALRAPFNTHDVFAKQGYAIFHQNLSDVGSDIATHVQGNFFTGFLNDAAAFEYAVPNVDFRTKLIADGITTLQEMIDKTLDYEARDLALGGTLADCNLNWFVGLTRYLLLDRNAFTGTIPAELGNLSNLTHLYLYTNQLESSIPAELGNLSNLRYLRLNGNLLEDTIPKELGNLGNLQYLYLYSNQLEGSIPAELGNLSNLIWLYLHTNQLTSYEQGAITPEMTSLVDIRLREQVTALSNSGLDSESVDRVVFDVADMLVVTGVTDGLLQLSGNFPHTSAIDVPDAKYGGLSAKDYITNTVANGGREWALTIETPI